MEGNWLVLSSISYFRRAKRFFPLEPFPAPRSEGRARCRHSGAAPEEAKPLGAETPPVPQLVQRPVCQTAGPWHCGGSFAMAWRGAQQGTGCRPLDTFGAQCCAFCLPLLPFWVTWQQGGLRTPRALPLRKPNQKGVAQPHVTFWPVGCFAFLCGWFLIRGFVFLQIWPLKH